MQLYENEATPPKETSASMFTIDNECSDLDIVMFAALVLAFVP